MNKGKYITIYDHGNTKRDYTFIDDIIEGVMMAIYYIDSMYEIFNIGNNQTIELMELVEAIEEASGITAKKTFLPEQPGDVKQTWAETSKANRLLGYKSDFNIKNGLVKFVAWYNGNRS